MTNNAARVLWMFLKIGFRFRVNPSTNVPTLQVQPAQNLSEKYRKLIRDNEDGIIAWVKALEGCTEEEAVMILMVPHPREMWWWM